MDFIERVFGFAPDGGDGMTELLVFAALIVLAAVVIRRRAATSRVSRS
jgi:hypothetical protein